MITDIAILYMVGLAGYLLGLLTAGLMQAARLRDDDRIMFPANPAVLDRFHFRGRTWVWSGSEWILTSIETRGTP